MKNPCYDEEKKVDCPRRCGGCAVTCLEWSEYTKARNEEYKRRYAESCANQIIERGISRRIDKAALKDQENRRRHRRHY